jgi:Na+-translocating ferredoxin:NAD+ oxidoreductase subunit B
MISAEALDALLPQTQCGECGYPGCLPYAQALALRLAPIDKCPPGGVATVKALSEALGLDSEPYVSQALIKTRPPAQAVIREAECIGCTKCIQACPVDAIIGSAKLMHSVITHECTGCGLCVEPCPVDCIELRALPEPAYNRDTARERFKARGIRLLREEQVKQQAYHEKRRLVSESTNAQHDKVAKHEYILQAMARAQAKKTHE